MMDSTGDLALWVGKRQVSIDIYVDWCNNSLGPFFDLDMDNVWNRSMVPFITWEITDCNHSAEDDPGITKRINNNTFDPYINQFGDRLKKWLAGPDDIYGTYDDRRAFVRLAQFESTVFNIIKQQYPNDFHNGLFAEWKIFRKYLSTQEEQQTSTILTQRQQCISLVKNEIIRDIFSQLSFATEIFLCAPISTATIERDFSTMNRILTDLRYRLTTDYLEQLMRISIEEPFELDNDLKDLINDC
ncbi:unnamed protein product [Rotaria magnacalcarata]|uniref:HAT C-terminal dimerisation domain-containing protein n=2 Tax=Rotaria magnacalcarata TaxID=392030 RepID=A0A818XWT1_9BILA|nr:unnamed protein product [Rotaria magnacalcarata]CAF2094023.1 unnamed protein product [Rotaria magnacalcarata]CAF2132116.1 unnamed protein product [Rotaria magnacalcarata]CAF3747024.1 unnamed protein product [Rotaria magnacalcarata]CAF3815270.1 unnamed protein product [Rotaria magnacalcarata]